MDLHSFALLIALFSLIVVLSHFLEGITGFGSTALSMPFLTVLLGIDVAKPLLTLYTLILTLYVLARAHRDIDWKSFGRMMGVLVIALPIGIWLYNVLPQKPLLALLAVFMILVSVRGLLTAFGVLRQRVAMREGPALLLVFLGGIMHGAFSSGGPLIILYATERIKDKSRFRATMCMVWLTLNTLILVQMALGGQLTSEMLGMSLWGLPALVVGTLLGDLMHKRISGRVFLKLTYFVLLLSGVFMLVKL